MDAFTVLSVAGIIAILSYYLKPDRPAVNGIYSQPNKWYWLKYGVFRLLLWLRKRNRHKEVTGKNAGMGTKSRNSPEEMDKVQSLPLQHPKAVDAVYITGSNKNGQFLVTATARRHDNHVQTILFLRTPDLGLLELPSMPDTSLDGTEENEYAAGGLHIQVVEPMKKWNICFKGKLRQVSTGKLLSVNFDLTWVACTKYFDFDTDLHPAVLCDAIARERWSRDFFKTLQNVTHDYGWGFFAINVDPDQMASNSPSDQCLYCLLLINIFWIYHRIHQTHYEQFGDTTGVVNIDDHDPVHINIRGVRDHSYGNIRDWKQLHRYCIQYASMEDGTNLCVSTISMPLTTSRLHCGFIFYPSGQMEPLSWCNMEFQNFGDRGKPTTNFMVRFKAGGRVHSLTVEVLDAATFYIGDHRRDATIHERYCKFHMDGLTGYGLSEWEYGNTGDTETQNTR